MKQYQVIGKGGLDNLVMRDAEIPSPLRGQVLIRMHAASLNFRDLAVVSGEYAKYAYALPDVIPLSDGAGEIVALGDGVDEFAVGDKVATCFWQSWLGGEMTAEDQNSALGGSHHGVLCEYRALDAAAVVHVPEHLNFIEAATLPCSAVTAWNGLKTATRVGPGTTVVVLGTGGVAVFAAQFAHGSGAQVIATSSSNQKLERIKGLGATHGINYKETDQWANEVKRLTDGRGADLVIETVGATTLEQSIQAIRMGGAIAIIGAQAAGLIDPITLMLRKARAFGIQVGSRQDFEDMNRAIAALKLKPVVDRVFPFGKSLDAFAALQAGGHFGKIVIEIGE